MNRDRGVSDLLGFALVFGIVVLSIALIYTGGTAALDDLQHGHAMTNADRAFDVLADNVDDIHRHGAPARSTELTFASGEMRAAEGDPIEVNVTVTAANGTEVANETFVATPVTYSSRETAFHYVGGAVVRTDRGSSVVVRDPPFRFGADRTVLSFVSTTAEGSRTFGGTGTIRVGTIDRGSSVPVDVALDDSVTVSIAITSPRYRAWDAYLDRAGLDRVSIDADAETVTFSHETDAVALRRTIVSVSVSS